MMAEPIIEMISIAAGSSIKSAARFFAHSQPSALNTTRHIRAAHAITHDSMRVPRNIMYAVSHIFVARINIFLQLKTSYHLADMITVILRELKGQIMESNCPGLKGRRHIKSEMHNSGIN